MHKWLIFDKFARVDEKGRGRQGPLFLSVTGKRYKFDRYMIDKVTLVRLIEDKLADSENYLVDVIFKPDNLIVVEIDNDEAVCVEDCADLSNYLEECLGDELSSFDLEVGSAGITAPFKLLRQYQKNIGNEVEVLLKKGEKKTGVLKFVDEEGIVLTVVKKVKPEGAKRKIEVEEDLSYLFDDIKQTKYLIRFK